MDYFEVIGLCYLRMADVIRTHGRVTWTTKKARRQVSSRGISFSFLQRQPAFDTFDGSLFAVLPSLSEDQTLQEVPTGLDSVSHGNLSSTLTDAWLPSASG